MNTLDTAQITGLLFAKTRGFGFPLLVSTIARTFGNLLRIGFFVLAAYLCFNFSQPLLLLCFLLVVARACASYIEHFSGHWVAFAALAALRIDLYRALVEQTPGLGARVRPGDVATAAGRDIDRIEVFYAHTLVPVAATTLTVPILIGVASWAGGSPSAIAATVWLVVSAFITPWALARTGLAASQEHARRQAELGADTAGWVAAQPLGQILPGFAAVRARIIERTTNMYRPAAKAHRADALRYGLGWIIDMAGVFAVIASAMPRWAGHSQENLMIALIAVGACASVGVSMTLRDTAPDLLIAFASAKRLFGYITSPPRRADLVELERSIPANEELVTEGDIGGSIRVRVLREGGKNAVVRVYKARYLYPDGRQVGPFSFQVNQGAHVAITGPSGSGKSTLATIIAGVFRPDQGIVEVAGQDCWSKAGADPLNKITVIEQKPYIFAATVAENLRLASPTADDAKLWQALEAVGLAGYLRANGGLNHRIGAGGSTLSGGQRQRLCLARALLRDTDIYILDEVGSNLDEANYARIQELIREHFSEKTVIEISHRLGDPKTA